MAAMSVFGASRFTAILAALAISGTTVTFWWAIQTRSDLKAGAIQRSADRSSSSKPAARGLHPKDERSNKFELMGRSERLQPSPPGGVEDGDPLPERSAARVFVNYASPPSQTGGADMPLPIPPAPSDPVAWQVKAPDPLIAAPPLPAENQKRQTRELRPEPTTAATPSPKPSVRSYYMEKVVEQGDAGELKFRYRRQSCEPPNMPDVCFMPQANRRGIVVERR
jgi:hypothetical protein